MRTKLRLQRRRQLYPEKVPSYLLPPVPRTVVFDPSLRRAGEAVGTS